MSPGLARRIIMLFLYRHNRMESLLAELAGVLSRSKKRVLSPEVLVVQSLGMERWLSMGLADRFGVWANAEYPFPRTFIETIADTVLGPQKEGERYTREIMALGLASILSSLPAESPLVPLLDYLTERPGIVARLELAEQLAEAFDQVQIYRPDWFLAWGKGLTEDARNDFRPALYRLLASRMGKEHAPTRIARLVEHLERGDFDAKLLPERISLFGVASLPPMFIRVFDALSRHLPVHWFLLTASREYIGEEYGNRQLVHVRDENQVEPDIGFMDPAWSSRQPLVASFGRIMRDMGLLLEQGCHYVDSGTCGFVEPEPLSVLSTLQGDLCALRRRASGADAKRLPLRCDDRSLEIHACHGPRRELEVLRELLLDAFEQDPSLRPEDVIVLLRDVESYAPLVEAVFSSERGRPGYIPFTLSDRAIGASNPLAEALVMLLELVCSRMTVVGLMHLLEQVPLLSRFGIVPSQLPKVREWLERLRVSWGVDLADRARDRAVGQPENTLRFGLSRLLLGAARDARSKLPWNGLLPVDIGGDDAELVGRVVECTEAVFDWRDRFSAPRCFGDWHQTLSGASRALLVVESSAAWQLADLLQILEKLQADAASAGFDEAVPAEVVAAKIRRHCEQTRTAQTLLSGGVTFCRMLPMRGIPARLVAMVGLDDGSFPRPQATSTFDDVARSPSRPGDRSARDEDRHLFLETLLAARERLIITYRGRDPRDDSVLPRSVVVEELLTVVDESFECEGKKPSDRLVLWHPLHAHDSRHFDGSDSRRTVHSVREYEAALALERYQTPTQKGMTKALDPIALRELDLDALERFWSAPSEYFYRERLGARLTRERAALDPLDPTDLDPLERYSLTTAQLQALLDGSGAKAALLRWTAEGKRPFSNLGSVIFGEQLALAQGMSDAVSRLSGACHAEQVSVSAPIGDVLVLGVVPNRYRSRIIDYSLAKMKPKDRLAAWLRHLLVCASGAELQSWILRRCATNAREMELERLRAVSPDVAIECLDGLVRWYALGQRAPLAFFPQLSWDYAQRIHKGGTHAAAIERAVRDYGDPLADEDDEFTTRVGPREVLRLFGDESPLDDAWPARFGIPGFPGFAAVSRAVFEPYFLHVEVMDPAELPTPTSDAKGSAKVRGASK